MDEAAGDGAAVRGAVDVGEGFLEFWGVGGEVGVPDPVVQALSGAEVAVVGGDGVAVGLFGELIPPLARFRVGSTYLRRYDFFMKWKVVFSAYSLFHFSSMSSSCTVPRQHM